MENITRVIKGLSDVLLILDEYSESDYVYRGEASTEFILRPKLGRFRYDSYEWSDAESTLLRSFKRKSLPFLTTRPKTEMQWLAVAQHHGLATRLLDWTENLLVACYFAVEEISEYDSVLYALDVEGFEFIEDDDSPFNHGKVFLHEPMHISQRIAVQKGLFSIHPDPTKEFKSKHLNKWIIPKEVAPKLLNDLDAIGVNIETLFPGLESVAMNTNQDVLMLEET